MAKKEYIEREAVKGFPLRINNYDQNNGSLDFILGIESVIEYIEELPAADVVKVKHGYWHLLNNCANEGVYCSVCNKKVYKTNYANQKIKSPYCPNCGAKMDGGKNV